MGALHLLGAQGPPQTRISGARCTLGPGGKAQVPPPAGTSLTQALAAASGSAASLCIMDSALLQGLSSESGEHLGAV